MRKLLPVVIAFALAIPATASAGTVTGRVTDLISGAGVPNVRVGIGVVPGGLQEYTQTAADGSYSFENVAAGHHVMCFLPNERVNLLRQCYHDDGFYGAGFDVPESGTVTGI